MRTVPQCNQAIPVVVLQPTTSGVRETVVLWKLKMPEAGNYLESELGEGSIYFLKAPRKGNPAYQGAALRI
jgi:hypothetical protein